MQYDWVPYKKEKPGLRHVHSRISCDGQGRDRSEISHGTLQIDSKPPGARRQAWSRFSPGRTNSADTSISDFEPPEPGDNTFLLWYFLFVVLCYSKTFVPISGAISCWFLVQMVVETGGSKGLLRSQLAHYTCIGTKPTFSLDLRCKQKGESHQKP